MIADIVIGMSYGDEGKGKVTHHLLKIQEYTHCIRFNGGCNAGHTIYHNGNKFVTHHIPAGVFFGIKSIIGNGCVVNLDVFNSEIRALHKAGIQTKGNIFISENAHIITSEHIEEDSKDKKIGTTGQGNGPAYRDKYSRTGVLAKNHPDLIHSGYLINLYEELHENDKVVALFEGAQGFGLDIDWGDYPYVTSSHCTVAGALLNGLPYNAVRNVWGVAKAYDTYVGNKKFEGSSYSFDKIRNLGHEFGSTTGRPRQCNWLDIDLINKSATINGVTKIVINKVDILRKAKVWAVLKNNKPVYFDNEKEWTTFIRNNVNCKNIIFSYSPERI